MARARSAQPPEPEFDDDLLAALTKPTSRSLNPDQCAFAYTLSNMSITNPKTVATIERAIEMGATSGRLAKVLNDGGVLNCTATTIGKHLAGTCKCAKK